MFTLRLHFCLFVKRVASYFLLTVGLPVGTRVSFYCLHESSLRFPHLYLKSCNWTVVCFKNKFLKWHQLLWASPGTEVSRRAHKKATETESGGGESEVCAKAASCWVSPPSSPSAAQTEPFHHHTSSSKAGLEGLLFTKREGENRKELAAREERWKVGVKVQ